MDSPVVPLEKRIQIGSLNPILKNSTSPSLLSNHWFHASTFSPRRVDGTGTSPDGK
jgi:hypothetical protein